MQWLSSEGRTQRLTLAKSSVRPPRTSAVRVGLGSDPEIEVTKPPDCWWNMFIWVYGALKACRNAEGRVGWTSVKSGPGAGVGRAPRGLKAVIGNEVSARTWFISIMKRLVETATEVAVTTAHR